MALRLKGYGHRHLEGPLATVGLGLGEGYDPAGVIAAAGMVTTFTIVATSLRTTGPTVLVELQLGHGIGDRGRAEIIRIMKTSQ